MKKRWPAWLDMGQPNSKQRAASPEFAQRVIVLTTGQLAAILRRF